MAEGFRPVSELVEEVDVSSFLAQLEARFGIPRSTFADLLVFRPSSNGLAIVDRGLELPDGAEVRGPEVLGVGMPFFYDNLRDPRMTTAATVKLGRYATRNVADLDPEQAEDFVARRDLRLTPEEAPNCTGPGYVIARCGAVVIGLGVAKAEGDVLVLRGMVPRSWQARR